VRHLGPEQGAPPAFGRFASNPSLCALRADRAHPFYKLVQTFGSTSQVTYDRKAKLWRRRDSAALKHKHEISVQPFTGEQARVDERARATAGWPSSRSDPRPPGHSTPLSVLICAHDSGSPEMQGRAIA
jgi:hypothetical protein